MKKAEMGVGTLIIFIALLLVAAIAAGVLIQTTGSVQEKALMTGDQVETQVGSKAQVIEVSGINGRDGLIEEMSTLYKLAPGSNPIKLDSVLFSESTARSSTNLRLREGGANTNDIFTGYFTASKFPYPTRTVPFNTPITNNFYTTFSSSQTSELMIGKVAVAIIFPESNGGSEPNDENWTVAEQDAAINHAREALNWWNAIEPRANLRHTFEIYRDVRTTYEPIKHDTSLASQELWINETLDRLGVAPGPTIFTRIRAFNDDLRKSKNAHWAFTLFVVDSSNTPGGGFPDGMAGIAYINGPHVFVGGSAYAPYQSAMYAHEFAHIFGARDQYSGCACANTGGYFNLRTENCIANGCLTNTTSLMRSGSELVNAYNNKKIDVFALGQLGLIDGNQNNLLDPIDEIFESSPQGANMTDAAMQILSNTNYVNRNIGREGGYFTFEHIQTGGHYVPGNLQPGDVIKLYHESSKTINESEEIRINFIPKSGASTLTQFITPDVISEERVYLYPLQ